MTNLPSRDRYGFPLQVCRRCAGSGKHSYNQMHGDVCYGCDGRGVRHTPKAKKQFQAWSAELKKLRETIGKYLTVGDEVAIIQYTHVFSGKIIGWHVVTSIEVTSEVRGWSITWEDGKEIKTPSAWEMHITFDDGESITCCTQSCFRRQGWIDYAPYVQRSIPRARKVTV